MPARPALPYGRQRSSQLTIGPQDVTATVLHHLGIDARKVAFPDQTGRPIWLVEDGEPIRELVG